jgi:hypothetical protein
MSGRFSFPDWVFVVLAASVAVLLVVRRGDGPDRSGQDLAARLARLESAPTSFPASVRDSIDDLAAAIRALEDEVRQLERASRASTQPGDGAVEDAAGRTRSPLSREARARDSRADFDVPDAGSPEWEAQMQEYAEQFLAARVEDVTTQLDLDEEQAREFRRIIEEENLLLRELWAKYRPGGKAPPGTPIQEAASEIRRDRNEKLRKLFGEEKFETYKGRYPDPPVEERK